MKVIQFIKKVNNTELGKGGTHETYILVPREADVSDIFEKPGKEVPFSDKNNGNIEKIRLTKGGEKRIVGLGPFYSKHKVSAGDSVLIERRMDANGSNYYISVQRYLNNIVLQKIRSGFEILEPDKCDVLNENVKVLDDGELKSISINFLGMIKKRTDSPSETESYEVNIDGIGISDNYKKDDMIQITVCEDVAEVAKICPWEKYNFDLEE